MSRFLKIAIVLLAIAAMVTPAMAEDMLSLGGQMRVRGWYLDNDQEANSGEATRTWVDQRLRIGGKLSVADGVSITFRTDITESNWGSGNLYGSGRTGLQQWDRAHIDLAFDSFSLRAGQQFVWFLNSGAFNTQSNGLKISTKGPVALTAFAFLQEDNGASYSSGAKNAGDADGFDYGVNLAFGADAFKANILVAAQNKVTNSDEDVYLIGADATFNMDAFKLIAELDFFTGDSTSTVDAFGTQLFVDGSLAASEALTVGGQLYYALGDTDDDQYTYLGNDFGAWDPLYAHGSGLDNEQLGSGRPFVFFGNDAGVIAGRIYADAKVSDAFKIGGSISYLEPEEDAVTTADSAMTLALGMKYAVMAHTSLGAQLEYIDVDAPNTDASIGAGVGLFVNF